MKKLTLPLLTASVLAGGLVYAANQEPQEPVAEKPVPEGVAPSIMQFFGALPKNMDRADAPSTKAQIALGRKLYFEKRLSKDGTLSCNSCHGLDTYGVDNAQFSSGVDGKLGGRNAPTVYMAAAHVTQFWDGRAADVEEQALGPILNPVEMAMDSAEQVVGILKADAEYPKLFAAAFPEDAEALTWNNLGRAIGAFERQLVTPSRFDDYLLGDASALTEKELRGFKAFVDTGCFGCHNGPYMGGQIYMKLGLVKEWPSQKDLGRFDVTGVETHKMVFKVPSLRNVAKTGPYFHDGSVDELEEAVRMMSRHQRGIELTDEEATSIVDFLGALTGELPKEEVAAAKASTQG
ncbi:MAG: cytochrome-c peroxidase [Planctomycetota bacterium]